jgi:excisionase family DNA binding protein
LNKLINVKELSEYLNINQKTIYHYVETLQIPHLKINSLVRFDLEKIELWLESKNVKTYNNTKAEKP